MSAEDTEKKTSLRTRWLIGCAFVALVIAAGFVPIGSYTAEEALARRQCADSSFVNSASGLIGSSGFAKMMNVKVISTTEPREVSRSAKKLVCNAQVMLNSGGRRTMEYTSTIEPEGSFTSARLK